MASVFCGWLRLIRFFRGISIHFACIILLLVVLRYRARNQIFQHVPGKSPIGQIIIHCLSLKSTSDKIYSDSDSIINFVLCPRKTIWLQQFPIYHHLSPPITIYHLRNPPEFRCFFFFPSSGFKDPTGGAGQRSHRSAGRETLQGTAGVAGDGDLGIFVFGKKGSLKYCSMDGCMDSMDLEFEDMCYIYIHCVVEPVKT